MKKTIIIIIIFIIGIIGGYVLYDQLLDKGEEKDGKPIVTDFGEWDEAKAATHLSDVDETDGAYWRRGGWFFWNQVEKEQGTYDWSDFDERVEEYQEDDLYLVFLIMPFANWDQEACHPEDKYISIFDPKKGGTIKVGKPCDMNAYAEWLTALVERYDGDGIDDASTLLAPIRYWEVANEPLIDEEDFGDLEMKFFVGTHEEYLDILKVSYETIKAADSNAVVLHAGPSGWTARDAENWKPFFEAGAGDYFDVADMHTIDTTDKREDLNILAYKEFLAGYGLEDKPLFITEVQYWGLDGPPKDIDLFNRTMARSTVFALAHGADKLFYISSWLYWEDEKMPTDSSTQAIYENLVDQVGTFDSVEILKDEYINNSSDWDTITTTVGQYKFISGEDIVYILWGKADLPLEVSGTVSVTDMHGETQTMQVDEITLSDEPIFIKLK